MRTSTGIKMYFLALLALLFSTTAHGDPRALQPEDLQPRDYQGYVETHGVDSSDSFNLYFDIRGQTRYWGEGSEEGAEKIGYTPTIVFESGYNGSAPEWSFFQTALSEHTLTVSYSRAGQGSSEPSPDPRTFVNQMAELHTALQNADILGPYIFVAHSSGGLKARVFADEYPEDVAGIVFVDASHEDQGDLLMNYLKPEALAMLPGPHFIGDESLDTLFVESAYVKNAVDDSVLRDLPVAVLASTNHSYLDLRDGTRDLVEQEWLEMQRDLAALSDYSTFEVDWSGRAGHYLHLEKPNWTNGAIIRTLYHQQALGRAKGLLK